MNSGRCLCHVFCFAGFINGLWFYNISEDDVTVTMYTAFYESAHDLNPANHKPQSKVDIICDAMIAIMEQLGTEK